MTQNKNFYRSKNDKKFVSYKLRNKKVVGFFTSRGFNVRLIGEDNPKIVIDDKSLLSCVAKESQLMFYKTFSSGNITKSYNLKDDLFVTDFELGEVIGMCEQHPVYRIRLKDTQLCIVGYNYDEDHDIRYPVFAVSVPWLYLTIEDAEVEKDRLLTEGYNVEVI